MEVVELPEIEFLIGFFLLLGLFLWLGLLWFYNLWLDFLPAWFFLEVTRYPLHVQQSAKLIVHCRVRINCKLKNKDEIPLFGQDRKLDEELEDIVNNFFEGNLGGNSGSPEKGLDEVPHFLQKDNESGDARKMYLRVSSLIAKEEGKGGEARRIASKHKLEPTNRADVGKARSDFRKQFRKELIDFWDSRAKSPFFSFSLKESALYLPILSVLIIVGAYLHLFVFYGHFNIEVSQFFSLDDYVASSIEEIRYSVFFVGVYLVFCAAVLRGYRSLEIPLPESERCKFLDLFRRKPQNLTRKIQLEYVQRERRFRRWVLVIAYFGCIAVLFCMIPESEKTLLNGWSGFFILLFGVLGIRQLVFWLVWMISWNRKHFRNVFAEIMLLSLVMFFSSMYLAACEKIEEVEKSPTKVYERETGIEDYAYKGYLIGASNRYIFLRNPDQNTTTIIPQSEAGRIVISVADRESEKKCSSNESAQNIESCSPCGMLGGWLAYFKNRLNCLFCN